MGEVVPMQMGPQMETLLINPEEFNILIAGLKQLPYIISQPLIDRLRAHVKAQMGESNALER